jgi:hypothetical protein
MSAAEETVREMTTAESGMVAVLHSSEIDRQIATARAYPRSIKKARDEIMELATLTEDVARECVYALPRKQDGKRVIIEGPSARFAEILAHSWGNARAGSRVIDDAGDFVTAQGVFHDLEKNVAITYEVKRRITDRNGNRYSADMIGTTANAACSIALRNAVLKGVPKALWEDAYQAARKVIMGDAKTLNTRRATALGVAVKFGLAAEEVCTVLGVAGLDDIGLEELAILHGICGALRDGDTTVERLLEEATGETHTKVSAVSERVRGKAAAATEKAQGTPKPPTVAEAGPDTEITPAATAVSEAPPADGFLDALTTIKDAQAVADLDAITARLGDFSEQHQLQVTQAIANRRKALEAAKAERGK